MLMQHVRKIGGTRIARSAARSADREAVMGGPRTQCVRGGWWRATGPVQVPTGKHPPLYLVRSDRREAKTDAGHEGTWLCGCGAAAWERRARARRGEAPARGAARVGDPHEAWSATYELRKAKETKNSRVLTRNRMIWIWALPAGSGTGRG